MKSFLYLVNAPCIAIHSITISTIIQTWALSWFACHQLFSLRKEYGHKHLFLAIDILLLFPYIHIILYNSIN